MRQIWIFLLTISTILITKANTLTCYICGDNNLDEFGECQQHFLFDCDSYASRFSKDERIYCRTTRSRAKNNTFTIMKECISEQDHYRTFPEKGYRLDEECDLVDIRGEEVAYCLCRSDNCNKQPIAEQFMAFEEKHPELFGELDETKKPPAPPPPQNFPKNFQAPLKIQQLPANFAAPAIVPINDLRSSESDIRRSQLRASGIETEISSIPRPIPIPNSREALELPIMNQPISEGSFVGLRLPRVEAEPKEPEDSNIAHVMKCIQCGDGNLKSSSEECKRQVQVECQSERSMCFTRQINIGNGLYGMEKMCVLPEQLVNEFGESAREQGCGSSNGGRVQYCACTSPSCNQIPLSQQMQIFNTNPPSRSHNVPELASPDLPPPPKQPPQSPPTAELVPPPQPIIPVISRSGSSGASQPGRSVEPPGSSKSFRCTVCSENDMADPTADCRGMSEEICDETSRFCVTKQTQISTSSFAMEKKCLSDRESAKFLPGEKIEEGCATSESGMVNYCICAGNLCNRNSLLQQAQMSGVREELEEQRHIEEEKSSRLNLIQTPHVANQKNVGIVQPNSQNRLPPVILDEDEDENQLEVARDIGKSEDEIIRDRQKEWARAEIASSSAISKFIFSIFILSIFRLFA
ncbi:unnamed protein product [Caenorhabditis angaria]|uniref:Uncharacterized protein n=1 Tax=Caenorhabditis angaria TaxID=860376 RepID=A0A9P1IH86_9PELO|nr:unnamed protein product [Caenorhabditis angaria]